MRYPELPATVLPPAPLHTRKRARRIRVGLLVALMLAGPLALLRAEADARPHAPGDADHARPLSERVLQEGSSYEFIETLPLPVRDLIPTDVAITRDGHVFVCDHRARGVVYDPNGDELLRFHAPDVSDDPEVWSRGIEHCHVAASRYDEEVYIAWTAHKLGSPSHSSKQWLEIRRYDGSPVQPPREVIFPDGNRYGLSSLIDVAELRPDRLLFLYRFGTVTHVDVLSLVGSPQVRNGLDGIQTGLTTYSRHRFTDLGEDGFAFGLFDRGIWRFDEWAGLGDKIPVDGFSNIDLAVDDLGRIHAYEVVSVASYPFIRSDAEPRIRIYGPGDAVSSPPNLSMAGTSITYSLHTWPFDVSEAGYALFTGPDRFRLRSLDLDGSLRWEHRSIYGPDSIFSGRQIPLQSRADIKLEVDPNGRIYVLDGRLDPPTLLQFEGGGPARTLSLDIPSSSGDVALHPDGRLIVSAGESSVHEVKPDGRTRQLGFDCDCPGGGQIAAGIGPANSAVYLARPRGMDPEIRVGDLGLDEAVGRLRLPEPSGYWPADLAGLSDPAIPGGLLYSADPAGKEVQRWTSDGKWKTAWVLPDSAGAHVRIDASRLEDGRGVVAGLRTSGAVDIFEALPSDDRFVTGFAPASLLETIGPVDDLAIGGDGRVYLSDLSADAIHVFGPTEGRVPTPDPRPSATPDLGDRSCSVAGDKQVSPKQVVLGQGATISLTLRADCPDPEGPVGADVMVLLDHHRGTYDGAYEPQPGSALELGIAIVEPFARGLDLRRHRIGLVSATRDGLLETPLSGDLGTLLDRLDALASPDARPPVASALDERLARAGSALANSGRPDALPVILLISTGQPRGGNDEGRPHPSLIPAIQESLHLRAKGVQIFSIQLETHYRMTPEGDDAELALKDIAGVSGRLSRVGDNGAALGVGRSLQADVQRLAGASLAGSLTIHDQMAPDIVYGPDSVNPVGNAGPDWLMWRRGLLPASGITLTYAITPLRTGRLPTNAFALADYTDFDGSRRTFTFPVPVIDVVTPSPTPTPSNTPTHTPSNTPTPSATPLLVPVYLPFLAKQHCRPIWRGLDVALIIDASRSMAETGPDGRSKIDAAREAVRVFAAQLDAEVDRLAVLSFNSEARLLLGFAEASDQLEPALAGVALANGTRMSLGIDAGVQAFSQLDLDPNRQKVLIVLTDGRVSGEPGSASVTAAERARSQSVLTIAVGLGSEANLDLVHLLEVAGSPARVYLAPDGQALGEIYRSLARRLPCGG